MKRNFLFLLFISCISFADCQKPLTRGRVIDEEGKPVPGATIVVRHRLSKLEITSKNSTVSNDKGEWEMADIGVNDLIEITAVGYEKKQLTRSNEPLLVVVLVKQTKTLEEVRVNTGYQLLPKERATGSFTQVNASQLNEVVATDVLGRLPLMANGVGQISQRVQSTGNNLMVRGLSTAGSAKDVLIVVDNFPYTGDLTNINPNDVESITVLKDAAATSIWGAKAGNGVIVINTKKGKYNQPLKIEVNGSLTTRGKPDLFYLQNMSTSDFIDVEKFLFSKGYRFSDTSATAKPPFTEVYEILFKQRKGLISQAQADAQIDALRGYDLRNEFLKYFYQPSLNQQYAVNFRGGNKNFAWLFSTGMDRNNSNLDNQYNRFTVRFDNSIKLSGNLELSSGIDMVSSTSIDGKPNYGSFNSTKGPMPPYFRFLDQNGNPSAYYSRYRQGFLDTLGAGKLLDWKYYPFTNYQSEHRKTELFSVVANTGLNIKMFRWLSGDIKFRYTRQQSDLSILYDAESFYARDLVNSYSQLNRSTGIVTYKIPQGSILDLTRSMAESYNERAQLNFNFNSGNHSLYALAGGELTENRTLDNRYRTYGYDPGNLTSINVDYANTYPTFVTGNGFIPNPASFGKTNIRFVSVFGNAGYSFKKRYGLSISGRRDASNLFGVSTRDKWKVMWSSGIRWDLSSEKFYHLQKFPFMQLRLTYGQTGGVDPSKVALTTISILGINPYTNTPNGQVANFVNPDLKWEQVNMMNLGLEFRDRSERIRGSLEYYRKWVVDMLQGVPLDPTAGITRNVIRNSGSMYSKGVDLELNTINIKRGFQWSTQFIFNYNRDKYTSVALAAVQASSKAGGNGSSNAEGYPVYGYFAYQWGGLDPATGDPQGYLNGQISKNYSSILGAGTLFSELVYIGNLLPQVTGAIANRFSYKGFSVLVRLNYKLGYSFKRPLLNYDNVFAGSGQADFAKRWQQPGDELRTNVPSMIYPNSSLRDNFYLYSTVAATKGDHLRLSYINLDYSISKKLLGRLHINNADLYCVINDIGIIWRANKYGIDPDYGGIPPTTSFSFGLRAGL